MTVNRSWRRAAAAMLQKYGSKGGTVKRAPLDPDVAQRIEDALYTVYNNIGPDSGWVDKTPSNAVFVDVLCDQIAMQHEGGALLSDADMAIWQALSKAEKRRLCLKVGP